ncbi:MAG: DUF4278 domain-containing protein [Leptolyngbyaceae cyanobacterium bins.59]|nr:DUF4278 domain-containing protein [Leptolyngbyaceae cyanobacterium bins.59]
MQLKYRGITYEQTSPVAEVAPSLVVGKYRGQTWQLQTLKRSATQQENMELKYRGATYRTGSTQVAEPQVTSQVAPAASVLNLLRERAMHQHQVLKHRHDVLLSRAIQEVAF